jgi:hypothetical protein
MQMALAGAAFGATGSINSITFPWTGGSGSLTYSTSNASSATINGSPVALGTNLSYPVSSPPEGTTAYYTLTVQPGGAQYVGSATTNARNPPYLIQFAVTSANGVYINYGDNGVADPMTVSWDVGNSADTQIAYAGSGGWQSVASSGSMTFTPSLFTLNPYIQLRAYAPDGSSANFGTITAQTAYVDVTTNAPNPAALNTCYTFTPNFVNVTGATYEIYVPGSGGVTGATGTLQRKFTSGGSLSGYQYTLTAYGTGYRSVALEGGVQALVANGWTGNMTTC